MTEKPEMKQGRQGRRMALIAIVVGLIVVGCFAAGPYIAWWNIQQAVASDDPARLARWMDAEALRQNLDRQLATSAMEPSPMISGDGDPFLMLSLGLATALAQGIASALTTPEGIIAILGEWGPRQVTDASSIPAEKTRWLQGESGFEGWHRFRVILHGHQEKKDEISLLLCRQGLSWRLCDISLPATILPE